MIFLQHPAKESIQNFISWEIYIYCKLFNIWLTWLQFFFFFLFSSFYTLEILTLYIIKVFDLQLIVMLFSYSWTFDKKHTFWVTYTLMHNFFFFLRLGPCSIVCSLQFLHSRLSLPTSTHPDHWYPTFFTSVKHTKFSKLISHLPVASCALQLSCRFTKSQLNLPQKLFFSVI